MSITGLIDKTFRPHKGAVYRHGLAMPEAEYETATGRRLFTVAQMEKIAAVAIDKGCEECEREINMLLQTIEGLRHEVNAHRNATMEADLRTQAAVRGEKKALADKVNLSELRRVMTEWHQQANALGFDGVPSVLARQTELYLIAGERIATCKT